MKGMILCWTILLWAINSQAQIFWDGEGGDGQWSNPVNWVGDQLPLPSADVLLDHSIVVGDYTVTLPSGNNTITVHSLEIRPGPGDSITLLLPISNTSGMAFFASAETDAVILQDRSVFINASGASSGTPISVSNSGSFRINNGGRYIHRTERGHTMGLVSRLSAEPGTAEGIFEFDVPGSGAYTISASGREYGRLIFSARTAAGIKTYTAAGSSPFTIQSDLEINSQATLSYGANTNTISVGRSLLIRPSATFNISNGSNNAVVALSGDLSNEGLITETGSSPSSGLLFNGSQQQIIYSTGTISQSVNFSLNNPSGIQLLTDLVLPFHLQFQTGKIFSASNAMLVMEDNATTAGASSQSFVDGPVKKIGDDDFIFPVGRGQLYTPLHMTGNDGAGSDEFVCSYERMNPRSVTGLGGSMEAPLHHISYVEFWYLSRVKGNSSKSIQLTVTPGSFAKQSESLLLASFEGGQWRSQGNPLFTPGPPSPPFITGFLSSTASANEFYAFTIGSSAEEIINPLPVQLLTFGLEEVAGSFVKIDWETTGDEEGAHFILERKSGIGNFEVITQFSAVHGKVHYQYIDSSAGNVIRHYRLRIRDAQGIVSVSFVRSIQLKNNPYWSSVSIAPTIVNQFTKISIHSIKPIRMNYSVSDQMGREVIQQTGYLYAGDNQFTINTSTLAPGFYWVVMRAGSQKIVVGSFMKQ